MVREWFFVVLCLWALLWLAESHHGRPEEHTEAPPLPAPQPVSRQTMCCVCDTDRSRAQNYCVRQCRPVAPQCSTTSQQMMMSPSDPCQPQQQRPQCHVPLPRPPPPPPQPECPTHERYDRCQRPCEMQCDKSYRMVRVCVPACQPKCHCDPGYVRNRQRRCVNALKCMSQQPATSQQRSAVEFWPREQQQRSPSYNGQQANDPYGFQFSNGGSSGVGFASVQMKRMPSQ